MNTSSPPIVIAGAGLSGRLLALALAHQGLASAIFDPAPREAGFADQRTTAVAYAGVRLLKRLGLWQALRPYAAPIADILVTNGTPADRFRQGGVSGGMLHFPSSLLPPDRMDGDTPALGYIVDNGAMNRAFDAAVATAPLIELHADNGIAEITREASGVEVVTATGTRVRTPLLLACDGKLSAVRRRLGFRWTEWAYDQKAIILNITHTEDHDNVAHEMFYPAGPFAILPLTGKRCSIVWTEKSAAADALMQLPDAAFLAQLQARTGPFLGEISLETRRGIFPLRFGYAPQPVMDRVALVGDAAHTIHPIAGQGFNLAIKDIAALADVLDEAHRTGLDLGHGSVLDNYARWRRFDTTSMAFGTDAVNRLFSNNITPVRWVRSFGLGLVQKLDPLRVAFMRQSGADTGTLPSLMRPL